MMAISQRALDVPDSPIRKLVPLAEEAKARGVRVYGLNIGQPDVATAAPFLAAIRADQRTVVAYGRSEGETPYREALTHYYDSVGIDVTPEQIVTTVGGSEALLFAMQIACEPGRDEEILCFEPFYTNYNSFSVMSGAHLRPIMTYVEEGYHLPSEAVIVSHITPKTRAILICTPNNPTGTLLSPQEMAMIAKIAKEHQLFVISDEVYREFAYDSPQTSILNQPGLEAHAIMIDSISKRYSACGARIGCLVTRNPDVRAAAIRMAQGRLSPPALELSGALALTALGSDFFDPIREEYRLRRDVTHSQLMKIPGVKCLRPQGAFYMMAQLPVDDTERFAKWLLTDFEDQGETVMVAPGPGFYVRGKYASPGQGLNQIRIAYVLNAAAMERATELLKLAIERYSA